jgi:hypothetical protein
MIISGCDLRGQRQRHADRQGGDDFHAPHPGRLLYGVELQRDLGRTWRHTDHGWRCCHQFRDGFRQRRRWRCTSGTNTTVHSGGYELVGGGTRPAVDGVFFSGGGMMQLDSLLSQFNRVISGFDLGDEIGPHSMGFDSSSSDWTIAASRVDATAVNRGGNIFNLTLLGQYSAANAGADGHVGTLITDPSASSSVAQTPLVAHH